MKVLPALLLVGVVAQAAPSTVVLELQKRGFPGGDTISVLIHGHSPSHVRHESFATTHSSSPDMSPARSSFSLSSDVAPRISIGETLPAVAGHSRPELADAPEHRILFPEVDHPHDHSHPRTSFSGDGGGTEGGRSSFAFNALAHGSPISSADSLGHTPPLSSTATPRHPDMDRELISLPHPPGHDHLTPGSTPRTPRGRPTSSAFWASHKPGTPVADRFRPSFDSYLSSPATPHRGVIVSEPVLPVSRPGTPPSAVGLQEVQSRRQRAVNFVKDHGCCVVVTAICVSACGATAGILALQKFHKRDIVVEDEVPLLLKARGVDDK